MAVDPSKVKEYTTNLNLPIYKYAGTRWDAMINAVTTMLDGEVGAIKTEVINARDGELTLDARFQLLVDKDASQDDDILEYSQHATAERILAEAAAVTAVNAKDEAIAIVYGGEYSVDPDAGHVPIADPDGKLKNGWLNIGAGSDELPTNSYLGEMAYKDSSNLGTVTADTVIVNGRSLDRAVTAIYNNMPHVEAGTATSGILIPDDTETAFTANMARFFKPYFIPSVLTEELVIYDDAPLAICITTDKKIRVNHYGVYESEPLNVNNDWVTFGFGKADNRVDTTTIYFIANGRQIGSTIVGDYSDLAVRAIYQDGAVAGFYGSASPAHGYQNSAGTERINNPGDPVGYDYDLSPNGVDAAQGTSTARPLIGRMPLGGAKSVLAQNVDLATYPFGNSGLNTPVGGYYSFDGLRTAYLLTEDTSTGVHQLEITFLNFQPTGEDKTINFYVKPIGRTEIRIRSSSSAIADAVANFDLDAATITAGEQALSIESVQNGWLRCAVNIEFVTNNPFTLRIEPYNGVSNSYEGDGVSGILIDRIHVNQGLTVDGSELRYDPRNVTEPDVPDVYYHSYDVDDVLPRTLPAITGGTIIIGGKNGIWIDTLTFGGGTFSFSDDGYTGAPAGLYDLIGDLVAWFVADATLTEPQETAVVNWLKQKGCPGEINASAELLPNPGDPFTATTGWGSVNSATLSVESGVLKIQNPGSSIGGAREVLTVEVGEFYLFEATAHSLGNSNGRYLKLGSTVSGSEYYNGGNSSNYSRIVQATTTDLSILFQPNNNVSDAYNTVGGVSVKKLTLNTGA